MAGKILILAFSAFIWKAETQQCGDPTFVNPSRPHIADKSPIYVNPIKLPNAEESPVFVNPIRSFQNKPSGFVNRLKPQCDSEIPSATKATSSGSKAWSLSPEKVSSSCHKTLNTFSSSTDYSEPAIVLENSSEAVSTQSTDVDALIDTKSSSFSHNSMLSARPSISYKINTPGSSERSPFPRPLQSGTRGNHSSLSTSKTLNIPSSETKLPSRSISLPKSSLRSFASSVATSNGPSKSDNTQEHFSSSSESSKLPSRPLPPNSYGCPISSTRISDVPISENVPSPVTSFNESIRTPRPLELWNKPVLDEAVELCNSESSTPSFKPLPSFDAPQSRPFGRWNKLTNTPKPISPCIESSFPPSEQHSFPRASQIGSQESYNIPHLQEEPYLTSPNLSSMPSPLMSPTISNGKSSSLLLPLTQTGTISFNKPLYLPNLANPDFNKIPTPSPVSTVISHNVGATGSLADSLQLKNDILESNMDYIVQYSPVQADAETFSFQTANSLASSMGQFNYLPSNSLIFNQNICEEESNIFSSALPPFAQVPATSIYNVPFMPSSRLRATWNTPDFIEKGSDIFNTENNLNVNPTNILPENIFSDVSNLATSKSSVSTSESSSLINEGIPNVNSLQYPAVPEYFVSNFGTLGGFTSNLYEGSNSFATPGIIPFYEPGAYYSNNGYVPYFESPEPAMTSSVSTAEAISSVSGPESSTVISQSTATAEVVNPTNNYPVNLFTPAFSQQPIFSSLSAAESISTAPYVAEIILPVTPLVIEISSPTTDTETSTTSTAFASSATEVVSPTVSMTSSATTSTTEQATPLSPVQKTVTATSSVLSDLNPEAVSLPYTPTQHTPCPSQTSYNLEVRPITLELQIPSSIGPSYKSPSFGNVQSYASNSVSSSKPLMYELQIPSSIAAQLSCCLGSTASDMPVLCMNVENSPSDQYWY